MRNEDRDVVVTEIQSRVLAACVRQSTHPDGIPLDVLVNDTLYHELKRLENHPGAPLHEDDVLFWKDIKRRLNEERRKREALQLLTELHQLERRFGRDRDQEQPWGPRTLDLDLLFWGEWRLDHPQLVLPHPRLHMRQFVLEPLLAAMQRSENWYG